jgi:hypothetical protein
MKKGMVVGVDGLLPKGAKGGEQADGVLEIRWRFRLRQGEIYFVRLKFADWGSEEFYAQLQKGGQIAVSIEIVEGEAMSKGDVMKVPIQVRDE